MFKLRSTTALILSAALAAPVPSLAQSGQAKKLEACGDPIEAPCLTDDGFRAMEIKGQAKGIENCPAEVTEEAVPCKLTDDIVLRPMRDDTEMAAEGDDAAETEEMAEPAAAEEAAETEDMAEAAAADDAETEEAAETAAPEETAAEEMAETADAEQAAPASEGEDMAEEAPTEAEELPQIETAEEETVAEGEQSAEAEAPADGEQATQAETDEQSAESDQAAEAEASEDTLPQIEPEAEETESDTGSTETAAEAEGAEPADGGDTVDAGDAATGGIAADGGDATIVEDETAADATSEQAAEESATDAPDPEVIEVSEEVEQQRRERQQQRREAEATAAAQSAAASAPTDGEGEVATDVEVATEEVTEDTARSATEDFSTSVSGDRAASADDGGLSNFEKALLVGLGAVAVGSILDNGEEVVSNSGDRVVLRDDETGQLRVLKDDDALLRQPGAQVRTERFNDGSSRTTVTREDGTQIITIRAADGRVVRRARVFADGSQVVLFDDTEAVEPVDVASLPEPEEETMTVDASDEDALRAALAAVERRDFQRRFSLAQVREIREVRELAPEIELEAITFATGSAAIQPSQAEELAALGRVMVRIIEERPGEVFLIEGHTDAVGNAGYNLALSDRRAETVALALAEYFDVPPENLITQGYGEAQLKVLTLEAERQNRRAVVRRITPLLTASR